MDIAHKKTDDIIGKIEKEISKEYKKAHKEIAKKADDYFARFATKDDIWQKWVKEGKKTADEYRRWRTGQILVGKRWDEMRDTLAEDYANVAKISQSIANGYRPDVYALNHNYGTFQVEKGSKLDTSYTLYSRESVERLYRENPKLYKRPGADISRQIKEGKLKRWNRRRIQSVITQGVFQGESIPNLAKRLEAVTKGAHAAAIRNARTMITGVENAGRIDAFERANDLGIPTRKQWMATLDDRTRHWHRELDGQIVDVDEPFTVALKDGTEDKIMYPGDVEADSSNIYNCRCTLVPAIEGFEMDLTDTSLRNDDNLSHQSYEEWEADHRSTSKPITAQEDFGAAMKQSYVDQYAGYKGALQGTQRKYTGAEGRERAGVAQSVKKAAQKAGLDIDKAVKNAKEFGENFHIDKNFIRSRWDKLAKAERDAVVKYTSNAYTKMNNYLRGIFGAEYVGDDIISACGKCANALDKCKIAEDTILYRGMGEKSLTAKLLGLSEDQLEKGVSDGSLKGLRFIEKGFCSTGIDGSSGWDKDVMLKVIAPKGTKGMYVDPISRYQGEMELLLQKGTEFEIVETKVSGHQYWLKVIVTGQNK